MLKTNGHGPELADSEVLDLVGRIDPLEAAACLARCRLFVGNDSGLMHVAAAVGTPTVGLFGPSPVDHYRPWGRWTAVARTPETPDQLMADPAFEPVEINEADALEDSMILVLARIDETVDVGSSAAADERRRLREKLLRLMDAVPRSEQAQKMRTRSTITMSDVFNAALHRSAVTDDDILAVCPRCRRRTSLGLCTVVPGRETTYLCPQCQAVLMTLAPTADDGAAPEKAYRLGTFLLRTTVDLECPGARLPRSS